MAECWIAEPEKRPTFETLKWRLEDGPGEADYREAEMFMRWVQPPSSHSSTSKCVYLKVAYTKNR